MKILFVISGFSVGGGKNAYYSIVKYFAESTDYNVTLLSVSKMKEATPNSERFGKLDISISSIPFYKVKEIHRFIVQNKFKMVFVDSFFPSLAIRIAQIFVKNVTFVYRFGAIVYKPLQSVVYRLILFGQNIIVPAQSLKDYLEKSIFKPKSVNVVINFIPVRKPQKDQNIELDIEQRSKNIITVSRHVKRKRLERVIDFAKNYSEFNFYLIGGGKNIEAYKEHVSTLGLNNLHVLGEKSNMEAFYKRASLLFLPSKGEGFSYSVCEAVLNDCKVLVYDDLGGNNFYFQKDPNYFIIKNVKSQFELFEKATSNGFQPSDYSFLPSEKQMGHNYYEVISKLKD